MAFTEMHHEAGERREFFLAENLKVWYHKEMRNIVDEFFKNLNAAKTYTQMNTRRPKLYGNSKQRCSSMYI